MVTDKERSPFSKSLDPPLQSIIFGIGSRGNTYYSYLFCLLQEKLRKINVQEGDMVYVFEENQMRNKWNLGVIETNINTADGEI